MVLPNIAMWIISNGPQYCNGAVVYNTKPVSGSVMRWNDKTMDQNALWHFELVIKGGKEFYKIRNDATDLYMISESGGGAGRTYTSNTVEPTLYEVIPLYKDDTYLIVQENGNPIHMQNDYHWMVTWNDKSFGSASCFKIVAATKQELKQIEIKKANETTYKQVWADEFKTPGPFNESDWSSEYGFVRNQEAQWYQAENAIVQPGGKMLIQGKREDKKNPWYDPSSSDWKKNREWINYTSTSMITKGKRDWLFGRFEVKAQIPVQSGAWPAIWFLGNEEVTGEWPSSGEIDLMEYYTGDTLANIFWAADAEWSTQKVAILSPLSYWRNYHGGNWTNEFHIWRMDWDEEAIKLYLDDELINAVLLSRIHNKGQWHKVDNPYLTPQYLLINCAMGGIGGAINEKDLPFQYWIEYVRVYQQERHIDGIKCHICENK